LYVHGFQETVLKSCQSAKISHLQGCRKFLLEIFEIWSISQKDIY
jgi:hypothetical protein